jgi:hypothetical protein
MSGLAGVSDPKQAINQSVYHRSLPGKTRGGRVGRELQPGDVGEVIRCRSGKSCARHFWFWFEGGRWRDG